MRNVTFYTVRKLRDDAARVNKSQPQYRSFIFTHTFLPSWPNRTAMAINSSPASASSSRTGRALEIRRPATRSLSRITEDDSNDDGEERVAEARQRDSSQRRRTSFASQRTNRRSKSRTAMSMTERGEDPNTPRVKRTKIRPSLAGPQVHEMDIETRAQVLIPIAEDCIVQLLRAGLNGSIYRKGITQTWRLAWDSLQSKPDYL
jgi:hypothetical protein